MQYKDIWTPEIGENLDAQIEPNNQTTQLTNTLFLYENLKKLRHLKKGATGRFAKTIFFFLKDER